MKSLKERVDSHPLGNLKKVIGKVSKGEGFRGYSTKKRAEIEAIIFQNPQMFPESVLPFNEKKPKSIQKSEPKKRVLKVKRSEPKPRVFKIKKSEPKQSNKPPAGSKSEVQKAVRKTKIKLIKKSKDLLSDEDFLTGVPAASEGPMEDFPELPIKRKIRVKKNIVKNPQVPEPPKAPAPPKTRAIRIKKAKAKAVEPEPQKKAKTIRIRKN